MKSRRNAWFASTIRKRLCQILEIVRAWKDPDFRSVLSSAHLPGQRRWHLPALGGLGAGICVWRYEKGKPVASCRTETKNQAGCSDSASPSLILQSALSCSAACRSDVFEMRFSSFGAEAKDSRSFTASGLSNPGRTDFQLP